jgi:ribonuclease-3
MERLGHAFRDPALLLAALTHSSAAYDSGGGFGNERLEFLGDAVLGLVVARILYDAHPDWREGDLTRARATLVNTRALAGAARALDLGASLRLGRTEQRSGGERKERVLANLFEAVVGALYLDGGLGVVERLVRERFGEDIAAQGAPQRDPKTHFQEWAHARLRETPRYRLLLDTGVEDAPDRFMMCVEAAGEVWGEGCGRTKREAERDAALAALRRAEATA